MTRRLGGAPDTVWTPELVTELCRLWKAGVSAGLIAVVLGHSLTRSAVLGKLWRMKMQSDYNRPRPPRARVVPPPVERPKPSMPRLKFTETRV